jgi:hypothetical protein
VHFTDYAANDGPTSAVILTGAVGDYGQGISVNPDGSINGQHNSELKLALAHGSFRMSIVGLDSRLVGAFPGVGFSSSTCSATVKVTASSPIVADPGLTRTAGSAATST